MGAGHLIASYDDTTVVTVLGGRPPAYPDVPSEWDALGGFVAGDDVVAVRREEDAAAMAVLESGYEWLEFSDHQYLAPPDRPTPADVAPVLAAAIAELDPHLGVLPDGSRQPRPRDGARRLPPRAPGATRPRVVLLRGPRLQAPPGLLAWRVAKLLRAQPWPTPAIVPHVPDEERKRRAIWCYTSQIAPLEQDHALTARMEGRVPEQFWHLAPPPAGVGRDGRPHLIPRAGQRPRAGA